MYAHLDLTIGTLFDRLDGLRRRAISTSWPSAPITA